MYMKTNKSRRNKRQSRFRNTRNKRRVSKRQRGGDQYDEKFVEMAGMVGEKVRFAYDGTKFEGEILRNTTPSLLVIGYLTHIGNGDSHYRYIISYFGTSAGNVIKLQKPSAYLSYFSPEKKKIVKEIINSMEVTNSQQQTYQYEN